MKLYVKEKLFSLHNRFFVKDENGCDVYEISSKMISFCDKTTIRDTNGNKIAYIEQELFHFTPHYNIYINDILEFKIKRKFQVFKNDYVLSNGYRVDGKFMMFDLIIYDDNNIKIGSIHRRFLTVGDKYEIQIEDEAKKEIVLAIIVAIANDINRCQNSGN